MASNSGLSAGSRVISDTGSQAGSLDRSDGGVKLLGNGRPRPSEAARQVPWPTVCEVKFPGNGRPPPTRDVVKYGVVRGPSSDHSGLGSTPKLNFSVIVTPACAADMETEVLVACGAPERRTTQKLWYRWRPGNVWGGVVPHPANEKGRTAGPGRWTAVR